MSDTSRDDRNRPVPDPAVIAALAFDGEKEDPSRRLPTLLVLVRALYAMVNRVEASLQQFSSVIEAVGGAVLRIETAQRQAPEASARASVAASRQSAFVPILIPGAFAAIIVVVVLVFGDAPTAPVTAPTKLVAEVQALNRSNAVLTARVNDLLRCTREECLAWRIEGTGADKKLIRDKCQLVIDPVCLANPAATPAPPPAP